MYGAKDSVVIGCKTPITYVTKLGSHKSASLLANHSTVFHPVRQITEFR